MQELRSTCLTGQANKDIIPAINYGIDRQAIVDAVLLVEGMTAYSPIQRNVYNDENMEHFDYDPEKAEEILQSVGCEKKDDGYYYRNGEKLGFVICVGAGDQVRVDIAQAAAQQLKAIGIDVTVEVPAQVDWEGQMAYLIGWGSPFDADDHTYKVFGTGKGANYPCLFYRPVCYIPEDAHTMMSHNRIRFNSFD